MSTVTSHELRWKLRVPVTSSEIISRENGLRFLDICLVTLVARGLL